MKKCIDTIVGGETPQLPLTLCQVAARGMVVYITANSRVAARGQRDEAVELASRPIFGRLKAGAAATSLAQCLAESRYLAMEMGAVGSSSSSSLLLCIASILKS
jgi:hypothetical protein